MILTCAIWLPTHRMNIRLTLPFDYSCTRITMVLCSYHHTTIIITTSHSSFTMQFRIRSGNSITFTEKRHTEVAATEGIALGYMRRFKCFPF